MVWPGLLVIRKEPGPPPPASVSLPGAAREPTDSECCGGDMQLRCLIASTFTTSTGRFMSAGDCQGTVARGRGPRGPPARGDEVGDAHGRRQLVGVGDGDGGGAAVAGAFRGLTSRVLAETAHPGLLGGGLRSDGCAPQAVRATGGGPWLGETTGLWSTPLAVNVSNALADAEATSAVDDGALACKCGDEAQQLKGRCGEASFKDTLWPSVRTWTSSRGPCSSGVGRSLTSPSNLSNSERSRSHSSCRCADCPPRSASCAAAPAPQHTCPAASGSRAAALAIASSSRSELTSTSCRCTASYNSPCDKTNASRPSSISRSNSARSSFMMALSPSALASASAATKRAIVNRSSSSAALASSFSTVSPHWGSLAERAILGELLG
eukprot:CAMPEP_0176084402 /NCGR_PEP_ID=MMETSP0120_2-20121206/42236_1 /TAXON_ID=160619 /ORGANISM="Kryptoperidinium foliaceum, Strain CCMP 1326" /LENGTH=380 /DNA_ID=CAMNT_0017418205 /DNA_START=123 /DNA_END=1261 /DNA_ORIENTATION=+